MKMCLVALTLAVLPGHEPALARAEAGIPTTVLAEQGREPRVGVGPDGTVAVAYGQAGQIFCRVSRDGGQSYAEAVLVATLAGLKLGMGRGPQVAVTEKDIVIAAIGKAGDVVAWRSADRGRSWTGPVNVNRAPASAEEGLLSVASGRRDVHAVWLDLRQGATEVYVSRSVDGGATWTDQLLYRSPDGHVCECCVPTIGADSEGGVAVMFRNWLGGSRDMYVAVSRDSGATFGPAAKLGTGTWPLDGCPMDGGAIALRGPRLMSVWRREKAIYASTGAGIEVRLGDGRNAAVVLGREGAVVAWEDGGIRLHQATTAAARLLGPGRAPALAAAPGGDQAFLAWERPGSGIVIASITLVPRDTLTSSR